MDILLTHGYFLTLDEAEKRVMKPYPPLGLLYISSHLKARGFDVEVLDNTFLDLTSAEATLTEKAPRLVGLYVNLMTRKNALKLIAKCKEIGAIVVLGGPEPSNYVHEYLSRGADIVVSGEGERALEELIPHIAKHGLNRLTEIRGIYFKGEHEEILSTAPRAQIENLDAQPFPDRAAIDLEQYLDTWQRHHHVRSVSLITARGCPYPCAWCSHSVYGRTHRRRSPKNVADEIARVREAYRPDQLWYADDVFTINPKWLERYAAELKRRKLDYPFETITREDRLNEATVRTLAEMGCYRLWIGAESGSQRILDGMDRRTDGVRMREMIALVKRHGIRAGTFIMVGYDGETWDDLNATAHHLRGAAPDDVLTTLSYPIKGTPYYDLVADRVIPTKAWEEGSDRDLTIRGRNSRRFYGHTQRWLRAEAELARVKDGTASWRSLVKARAASVISRMGMYATRNEVEHG
ncbi:MAG TPA: radical SAM protein [Micropepsaceae bacterium]|nr:radical SAM protein [Micropepsaceae bacterium]